MQSDRLRRAFWYLNHFFMVPMFRLGFGPFMGSPFGGYIMVLKVVGRKTGRLYYAPVNYAIDDGNVYCIAGFGKISDWYRNLREHPSIEVIMPGGTITGVAAEVADPAERLRLIRRIMINAGFAGYFYGYDPRTAADERVLASTADIPLIRIRPAGIGSGPGDPGGWAWIVGIGLSVAFLALLRRGNKRG